ncbi:phage tail protein, partial [Allorhizobium sp. BGMRC 0089]|uniref:phage tail protein n=1 Tax=Allorhizobium sonneratiae TaxID=2934936 RepID=UPI002033BD35
MKRILLVLNVLGFWLMAEPAHAGPVIAAISAVASFVGSLGIVGKVVLTVGLSLASSLLQKATQKKSDATTGTKLEIQMGDDSPVSAVMGYAATSGKRKYAGVYGSDGGTPNAYFVDVIELSNLPVSALAGLWVNDDRCSVDWSSPTADGLLPITNFRKDGKDYAWIKFYNGDQTKADPFLLAKFSGDAERPWRDTMVGRGCAYAIMVYRYNSELFSGVPSCVFELSGIPLYDIRKDSSAGGNGPHRFDDPATWEPSNNLAVQIYNVIRGMSWQGAWFYGGQNLAASRLPASNWIAAAQECDRARLLADGTSEPQFRGGVEFTGDTEPLELIDHLRAGCAGRLAEVGGAFKLQVGALNAAVYAFTDGDIIVTKEQSFEPFPALDDTVNAINATYPNPDEKWATKDAPALYDTALDAADGNRRLVADVQFPAVPYGNQVQQLMRTMLEEDRRFRTHQFYLPPDAWGLEPNDVVSWTSARNGYDNKKFIVVSAAGEASLNQQVTLREIDPADYGWSPSQQLPTTSAFVGTIAPASQAMTGWTVEAGSITDSANKELRPAIIVSCAADLDDIARVWVQVRLKATGAIVLDSDGFPYAGSSRWTISGSWCLSKTDYEVRGRLMPFTTRNTSWSDWISVTTLDLSEPADVLDGSITAEKIADAAITAEKIMDEAVTSLKLADEAVTTAKLAVDAVTADILASGAVNADKIADAAVTAKALADQAVDATKLAASIEPVTVVDALPSSRMTAYVTYNGESYRWNGSAYVKTVDTSELSGTISSTRIADLAITTPKLAANAVTAGKIAANAVTADTIAANAITTAKIAAGAVSADQIAAGAITTDKLAAGSITADLLAVGKGANFIKNSDFSAGLTGWGVEWSNADLSNFSISLRTDTFAPLPAALQIYQFNGTQNIEIGVVYRADGVSVDLTSVEAGKWYELSVYYLGHRCKGIQPYIAFADKSGSVLAYSSAGVFPAAQGIDPGKALANYQRAWFKAKAPAGAVYAFPFFRMKGTVSGQSDSYLWIHKPFFGEATANQMEPSPWSAAGVTLVSGGNILTGAITTDKLSANAVTAAKIAAGAVTATQIAAGSVTTDKIAAASITGDKVAANTIGANNIAAGAITAKTLTLTDYTNLVPNGNFATTDLAGIWSVNKGASDDRVVFADGFSSQGPRAMLLQKPTLTPAHDLYIALLPAYYIPVTGSAVYQYDISVWSNVGTSSGGFYFWLQWYDAGKNLLSKTDLVVNAAITGSRVRYTARITAPAGARFAQLGISNTGNNSTTTNLLIDYIAFRLANAAELIVDGSITANKLAVNSLSAISATLGNVDISNANIGNLQVGRSNIPTGAISRVDFN